MFTAAEVQTRLELPEGLIKLGEYTTTILNNKEVLVAQMYGYDLLDETNEFRHLVVINYFRGYPGEFVASGLMTAFEQRCNEICKVTKVLPLYITLIARILPFSHYLEKDMTEVLAVQTKLVEQGKLNNLFVTLGFKRGTDSPIQLITKMLYKKSKDIRYVFFHLWPECLAFMQD